MWAAGPLCQREELERVGGGYVYGFWKERKKKPRIFCGVVPARWDLVCSTRVSTCCFCYYDVAYGFVLDRQILISVTG